MDQQDESMRDTVKGRGKTANNKETKALKDWGGGGILQQKKKSIRGREKEETRTNPADLIHLKKLERD